MVIRAKKLWRRIKHTVCFKFFSFSPRAEWHLGRFSAPACNKMKVGLSRTCNCCHESNGPDCSKALFSLYMPLSVFQPVLVAIWESQRPGLSNFRSAHLNLFSVPLYGKDMLYLDRRTCNKQLLLLSLDFEIVNATYKWRKTDYLVQRLYLNLSSFL
jgi:hypothetical protein